MDSNYNFRLSISIVVDNLLVQDAFSHRQCHCINFFVCIDFLALGVGILSKNIH